MNPKNLFYRPRITPLFIKVFKRNFLVFLKNWKSSLMFNFLEPLLYLTALGFGLGLYVEDIQGLTYLQFIAPGLVASSAMWSTSFESTYGSFTRMQLNRIFHAMIATPLSLDEVVAGEILYGAFKSVLYGTVFLLVISLLGLTASLWALLIIPVLFFIGIIFSELGMIWTSISPNFDSFAYFFTIIITPMFLFSGIFFPLNTMPLWVQIIGWFTPLFHAVQLSRSLVLGELSTVLWAHFSIILAFAAVLAVPPLALMKKRMIS
ncbi:MAG: ABC transporter permease [Candidatus Contubernalis sp.]|nr:ABC transporter permease [Candidatus Contubernalis sp.]